MSYLALFDSFEYLCYESTISINSFILTVRGSTFQSLTSKFYPRAVRVRGKMLIAYNYLRACDNT